MRRKHGIWFEFQQHEATYGDVNQAALKHS